MSPQSRKHGLSHAENLLRFRKIWIGVLLLVLLPEFFVHHHAYFEAQGIHIDASWGFHAWFGFLACVLLVLIARVLGFFLKRKDDYYDE
ncbi:MAG: hypothetical protein KDI44_05430 [Thiothrix sp.]|nr:hypothetical protein [Thiothrix sp.]HPQ97659.1 hypothetical protein [Thiolinea sp.]